VGIALLNYDKDEHMNLDASQQEESEDDERPIEDRIEETSRAIGAVLLPMIEGLSKLTEEDIEEADFDDEDAQDD